MPKIIVVAGDSVVARAAAERIATQEDTLVRALSHTDLWDEAKITRAVKNANAVVHLDALAETVSPDVLSFAARGLFTLLTRSVEAHVPRFVVGSRLSLFARFPTSYKIDEQWQPRPTTALDDLRAFLAERSVCEGVRGTHTKAICLRFGDDVLTDAARAAQIVAESLREESKSNWRVRHIGTRACVAEDTGAHWRSYVQVPAMMPYRKPKNIVIFGAGGPLGAVLAEELANAGYVLRLCDIRPLEEIARENKPQSDGAPVAKPLPAPHENRIVDVRFYDAVRDACSGMDAIVNLTVVRDDILRAFGVNMLGAYNLCRAAVHHQIRNVVQTGPQQILFSASGYFGNYDIPGNAPARPSLALYAHSKFLGQEICRVFAENHGLCIPNLLFCNFVHPETATRLWHFSVSWRDAARALRAAVEKEIYFPYEEMNICADLPHAQASPRRAWELFDWEAQDNMAHLWKESA